MKAAHLRHVFPAVLAGLIGCATIGEDRVPGWPELQVIEHHVAHKEMRDHCGKYASAAMSPEACAEFDFAGRVCMIWFSADFPPASHIVEHERAHCRGYEHAGEHSMREMLRSWQAI